MDKEATEKVKQVLTLGKEETDLVSELAALPTRHKYPTLFEGFFLRGIKVDRIQSGAIICSFKVPPRLTGSTGTLSPGAIADLVDVAGGFAAFSYGLSVKATVNLSIHYLSSPKIDDELEMISRLLNHERNYSNTSICLRNKTNGELVANCQQLWSLEPRSKI